MKSLPLHMRLKAAKVGEIIALSEDELRWFSGVTLDPKRLVAENDYASQPPLDLLARLGQGMMFGVPVAYESETAVRKIDAADLIPFRVHSNPMPTCGYCRDCRWWNNGGRGNSGLCDLVATPISNATDRQLLFSTANTGQIYFMANFGCVQFERREA